MKVKHNHHHHNHDKENNYEKEEVVADDIVEKRKQGYHPGPRGFNGTNGIPGPRDPKDDTSEIGPQGLQDNTRIPRYEPLAQFPRFYPINFNFIGSVTVTCQCNTEEYLISDGCYIQYLANTAEVTHLFAMDTNQVEKNNFVNII